MKLEGEKWLWPKVIQLVNDRVRGNLALPEAVAHLSFPSFIMARNRVRTVARFSSFWFPEG